MKESRQSVKFPCRTVWGIGEEESGRSALNADAPQSVVGGVSVLPLPADHTGTSHVLPPRVITALVLLVIGLILVVGVRDASTPDGWSSWVMVPALSMYAVAVWLLRVECRDPWARRGGGRHEREE